MTPQRAAASEDGAYYGKYRGFVTDNDDPKGMGRVRARVPDVLGDVETGWALPCAPYAGDGTGSHTVPPVDAGVWIEFEGGDVSRPIWTGCWWWDGAAPEDADGREADPGVKVVRTESDLLVCMDDDGQTITIGDGDGRNVLTIEVSKGQITLQGASKATVEAPQIELVENATHPVVFGDELMSYLGQIVSMFNAHTHPGQMAGPIPVVPTPPVPPLPAPSPTLVSKRVKTE